MRRPASETRSTRARIVDRAVAVASAEGFGAMTLGRLAADVDMSKAGVIGHFGTMEALQLEAVERAVGVFREQVWEPAAALEPGLDRLLAVCDAWLAYVAGARYVGGCFTSAELSSVAAVRSAAADALAAWRRALRAEVRAAIAAGEIAAPADPDDLVFELGAYVLACAQAVRLGLDPEAVARARRAIHRALGVD